MNINKLIRENAFSLLLFVLLVNYGFVHFFVIPGQYAAAALRDYGILSVFTTLCILSCQLLALWLFTQREDKTEKLGFLALAYVLEIYQLRENDFHLLFTEKSLTSKKYYLGDYPILPKLIGGTLMLIFIIAFIYLILRYGWPVIKAFFKGKPWAVAIGFWGVIFVTSQIWDQSPFSDEEKFGWKLRLVEEYMEFMASAYLPLAMILYIRMKKKLEAKYPFS